MLYQGDKKIITETSVKMKAGAKRKATKPDQETPLSLPKRSNKQPPKSKVNYIIILYLILKFKTLCHQIMAVVFHTSMLCYWLSAFYNSPPSVRILIYQWKCVYLVKHHRCLFTIFTKQMYPLSRMMFNVMHLLIVQVRIY